MKDRSTYVFTVRNSKPYLHIAESLSLCQLIWTIWIYNNDFIKSLTWRVKTISIPKKC